MDLHVDDRVRVKLNRWLQGKEGTVTGLAYPPAGVRVTVRLDCHKGTDITHVFWTDALEKIEKQPVTRTMDDFVKAFSALYEENMGLDGDWNEDKDVQNNFDSAANVVDQIQKAVDDIEDITPAGSQITVEKIADIENGGALYMLRIPVEVPFIKI